MRRAPIVFIFACFLAATPGCDEETAPGGDGGGLGPNCATITVACHHADHGGVDPDIHDCHELAQRGDEDACTAGLSACLALCQPPPDGGVDAADDARDDAE